MACEVCCKVYAPNEENADVKPHLCLTCGLSFSLKIQLKRHALLHAEGAPYTCVHCVRISDDKSKTYNFRLGNKTDYICDICQTCFSNKRLLLRHSIQHTFDKISDTEENDQKVSKKPASIHKRKYSRKSCDKKEALSCGLCDRKFLTWLALEKHTLTHNTCKTEKSLFCKFCKKGFIYQASLEKHMKKGNCNSSPELNTSSQVPEGEDKKHTCNICGKTFARKSSLEGHEFAHIVDKVTSDEDKELSDSVESEKSTSKLKIPKKYNFEKSYTCDHCNFVCFSKLTLDKHSLNHRQTEIASSVTPYEQSSCEQSSEDCSPKAKLEKQRQQRCKNLICEICGRRFAGEICFKKHTLKHELDKDAETPVKATKIKKIKPIKELTCEYCNEVFTGRRSAYVKHIHAHTPEVCGICDARFVDRHCLREHCKIHVGTEEGRMFMQCSQKALDAKQVAPQQEPKVEYIYLVLR